MCPKASYFRCITTHIIVSKYSQTHYKKFSSREISKAFHGDGRDKQKRGDGAEKIGSAIGAKALKQG